MPESSEKKAGLYSYKDKILVILYMVFSRPIFWINANSCIQYIVSCFSLNKYTNRDPGCLSRIPDPNFSIPDPGQNDLSFVNPKNSF
jgi:hypothetical protein